MIRLIKSYDLPRNLNTYTRTIDELCNALATAKPGTFTTCEVLRTNTNSRTKVFFDIDQYVDTTKTIVDDAYIAAQREIFLKEVRLIFRLTGCEVAPIIRLASRHRVAGADKFKVSFRAWVSNYYVDNYAIIKDIIQLFKSDNLIRDTDGMDDSVYSSERCMNCIMCKKNANASDEDFMRPEGFETWPAAEVKERLKDYIIQHLNGTEIRAPFIEHVANNTSVVIDRKARARAGKKDPRPAAAKDEDIYDCYAPFSFLERLVMALPEKYYKGDREPWLQTLFAILHTGEANGYMDDAEDLCYRFSEKGRSKFPDYEKSVTQFINSYKGREDGFKIGTLLQSLRDDGTDEKLYADIALERYGHRRVAQRLWLFHRALAAVPGAGTISFAGWDDNAEPVAALFDEATGAVARHLGWEPPEDATTGTKPAKPGPVAVWFDTKLRVVAKAPGGAERVIGDINTARAHYLLLDLGVLAVTKDPTLCVAVRVGCRKSDTTAREAVARALHTINFEGDVFVPAVLRSDADLAKAFEGYTGRLNNRAFTLGHIEFFMADGDDREEYRRAFAHLIPPRHPHSLHDPSVRWDEDYDETSVRPCNLHHGIVVIRAAMGAGKTEGLYRIIKKLHPDAKVLAIVYNRALAHKFRDDFASLGIESYLDDDMPDIIEAPRVVVCLDSLGRIDCSKFDLVIIDEAVSLLQHFHSPLMTSETKRSVAESFYVILSESRHVLLMDAVADNEMMRLFVKELEAVRAEAPAAKTDPNFAKAFWSVNRHIRNAGKERCYTFVNLDPRMSRAHRTEFVAWIIGKVLSGKRMCVACSSKTLVDEIQKEVEDHPKIKEAGISAFFYTSATPADTLRDHMRDLNAVWQRFDLVVYSPTITAGMSFTVPHFDIRAAFFANDHNMPSVDMCIQQLYRSRVVKDDETFIFVDASSSMWAPTEVWEVERELRREAEYLRGLGATGGVHYDGVYLKRNLFHPILIGTLLNRGRSHMFFRQILNNTLIHDRGVVLTESVITEEDEAEPQPDAAAAEGATIVVEEEGATSSNAPAAAAADTAKTKSKKSRAKGIITTTKVPTHQEFKELEQKKERVHLSATEQQLMHNFKACKMFGVCNPTPDFIVEYVGSCDVTAAEEKLRLTRFRFKWLTDLLRTGSATYFCHTKLWHLRINTHAPFGTGVVALYTDSGKKPMYRAAEAAYMLTFVLPDVDLCAKLIHAPHTVTAPSKDIAARLEGYLQARANMLRYVFNLFEYRGKYEALTEAPKQDKSGASRPRVEFVKKLIVEGLGLELCSTEGVVTISAVRYMRFGNSTQDRGLRVDTSDIRERDPTKREVTPEATLAATAEVDDAVNDV